MYLVTIRHMGFQKMPMRAQKELKETASLETAGLQPVAADGRFAANTEPGYWDAGGDPEHPG